MIPLIELSSTLDVCSNPPPGGHAMNTCYTRARSGAAAGKGAEITNRLQRILTCAFDRFQPARLMATVVLFAGMTAAAFGEDRWQVLEAIHLVENPTNTTRIGSRGELGPYQFRPSTWSMHTKKPFYLAANRAEADVIAEKHYEWIKRNLEAKGVKATPYRIALAWNAGLTAAATGNVPLDSVGYARRVQNLVEDFKRQQVALARADRT